ncbi:MAG: sigma-70 family RNA polymerase sigma factor [Actinobacteria bacterium]|nr:sigma-70 family RNA polymerase sigma factor [Actinomycetota bacterium]
MALVPDTDVVRDPVEAGFQRGHQTSLKVVYDRYGTLIYTLCRKALGVDEAADITQEVFLAAWTRRHQFDPDRGSLGAWLVGIAKNKIVDTARKRDRRNRIVLALDAEQVRSPKFVDALADRLLLADALERLPERARNVLELAFYEELSQTEIAERCEMPLGTVKSDMRRGLSQLRRHLVAYEDREGLSR